MKKEITELLNSDGGHLKINNFCTLSRWQTLYGGPVQIDKLEAQFSITSAMDFTAEIKSRDVQGIIEEVKAAQTAAFMKAAEKYNKELANGYIG